VVRGGQQQARAQERRASRGAAMETGAALTGVLEAFRSRATEPLGGHGASHHLSCSQVSLSQQPAARAGGNSLWLSEVQDVLGQVRDDQLPALVLEAGDGDVGDVLKVLQHACPAGSMRGSALCLSLVEVGCPCPCPPHVAAPAPGARGPATPSPRGGRDRSIMCAHYITVARLRAGLHPRAHRDSRAPRARSLHLCLQSGRALPARVRCKLCRRGPGCACAPSLGGARAGATTGRADNAGIRRRLQVDALGANDGAAIVMAILEAISSAHENLARVLELLPRLLLSVSAFPRAREQRSRAEAAVLPAALTRAEMCGQ